MNQGFVNLLFLLTVALAVCLQTMPCCDSKRWQRFASDREELVTWIRDFSESAADGIENADDLQRPGIGLPQFPEQLSPPLEYPPATLSKLSQPGCFVLSRPPPV